MSIARASADDQPGRTDELEALRRAVAGEPALLAALERLIGGVAEARKAHATLVSDLAHELRTPLNAILGFTHLLRQDTALAAEQRAHVEVIHRSGEQLLALVSEVLGGARGDVDLAGAPDFDLFLLLDDLADMLYLRSQGAAVRLRIEREAGLPRHVRTDQTRLRQLLLVILGNVLQAGNGDAVAVDVTLERDPGEASGALRLTIAAPGLRLDDLQLQPFVHTEEGLQAQGEPQGLALAAKLAAQLGGRLHAAGDLLLLELPVGLGAGDDGDGRREARKVVGLVPGQPEYRILVAEDRWQSRQLLVQVLGRVGFSVREAADGREALMLWDTWEPHLVWMDMRMPVMTGIEATRRIKQNTARNTVVIALTASAFEEDQATALAAGCDDFVRKPLQMHEVFDKLERHLGVRFVHEAPAAPPPVDLDASALDGMPVPWLEALQQASLQADVGAILRMIDHVRGQASRAAAILTDLAERYNYECIIGLTRHALAAARGGA